MAGRPHRMAERMGRLENVAYALFNRLDDAMPEMYKSPRPRGRPDTLAKLWDQARSDMGQAFGSLLALCAALDRKAEGKRVHPKRLPGAG